jgi:hypothetical protein
MAVQDWAVPVGCAAGLGFMTHALLRGGLGLARCPDAARPVAFVLDLAAEQRPVPENRVSGHRVTECRLVRPI